VSPGDVKVVAVTQIRRGHGVSTAVFYLARALVRQGCRVLVVDLSLRRSPLGMLIRSWPARNLGLWMPPASVLGQSLLSLFDRVRRQVYGRVDCLLVDIDVSLIERSGLSQSGIDYLIIAAEPTEEGRSSVIKALNRLADGTVMEQASVLFTRIDVQEAQQLEPRLENGLPVLGSVPADYLLATLADYGAQPLEPHEAYQAAMNRLAATLIRLVPLQRGARRSGAGS
jgi:MinD superfamily P-loop ATPase